MFDDLVNMVELPIDICKYIIPAVNTSDYDGSIAKRLLDEYDEQLVLTYYKVKDGWKFVLHEHRGDSLNLIELAKHMGGVDIVVQTFAYTNAVTFIIRDTYELFPFTFRS